MADPVLQAVSDFLKKHRIRDQILVVGVSGGADSLALLHSLDILADQFNLQLHAAHLNHQLRGGESEADARVVEAQAQAWNVPVTVESHDVAAFAQAKKLSLEEAARMVRYGFLAQVAEREGASAVAVAHQADDQVETIVMHFLRGAGLGGLRGMRGNTHYPVHGPLRLLRPLLEVTRAEIDAYCEANHLSPRIDSSNADLKFLRNRLRHELLPILESYNPSLRSVLRHNARLIADDYDYIRQRVEGAWQRLILDSTHDAVAFASGGWRRLQPSLKRALIRAAVARLRPSLRNLDAQHVENALHVADHGHAGARATLPDGLFLFRDFDAILIGEHLEIPPMPPAPAEPIPLQVPGRTQLDRRWHFEAQIFPREQLPEDAFQGIDPLEAFFDADKLSGPIAIRARQANDQFKPLGLGGHSKELRRFMTDAKIPVTWRAHTPLVVADDEVIWVAGWRIADTVKIDDQTRRVLSLKFVRSD